MSDTPSDRSGNGLRREVEEKVDDLENRLSEVERALAERARLVRDGGLPADRVPPKPPTGGDPDAD